MEQHEAYSDNTFDALAPFENVHHAFAMRSSEAHLLHVNPGQSLVMTGYQTAVYGCIRDFEVSAMAVP